MPPKRPVMKPGRPVQDSGIVEIVRGGKGTGAQRTVTKGEPFPPTPKAGDTYRPVIKTKH